MAELHYRTQILANCAVIFPPPASPTLITLVDKSDKPLVFVTDSITGRLLHEFDHDGRCCGGLNAILKKTEKMLKNQISALRGGEPISSGERSSTLIVEDTNTTQLLEAEILRLRRENNELRQHLSISNELHMKAMLMVETSTGRQMEALMMAQRLLDQQSRETRGGNP
ncbi:hypothetical protein BDD12DRAFT_815605 [Trichophaea hybrida]|nr:hypothetical protein BDD12DRAFT_815605 [Trichophaea hybrida]